MALTTIMHLALDSATDFASVALYDGKQILAESTWRSHRRHTVDLAPQVDALLRLVLITPLDLMAVAVSIGAGSYTGTRVALSLAKGVVFARNLPLVGLPTLDVVAYPHLDALLPVCALEAAGRGRYGWALYAPASGRSPATGQDGLQRLSAWRLDRIEDLLPHLTPPVRFAGELSPEDAALIRHQWQDGADIVSPSLALRRAGVLADLAWRRWQAGETSEPSTLSPIYLG